MMNLGGTRITCCLDNIETIAMLSLCHSEIEKFEISHEELSSVILKKTSLEVKYL